MTAGKEAFEKERFTGLKYNHKIIGMIIAGILLLAAGVLVFSGGGDKSPHSPENKEKREGRPGRGENRPPGAGGKGPFAQYTLQLNGSLDGEQQKQLEELCNYTRPLQDRKLLVRAPLSRRDRLEELPFVRSVEKYAPENKMSRDLQDGEPETGQPETVQLLVTLVTGADRAEVNSLVGELGGTVLEEQGRYLRVELPRQNIESLAGSPAVVYVETFSRPELLNDRARDITGARPLAVPGFLSGIELTGAGEIIGLADSGLSKGSLGNLHPDLQREPGDRPRVIMLESWAGVETPADRDGHGTHMAGTLAGSGKASGGKYAGMAPGASLFFQGIMDKSGNLSPPLDLAQLFGPAYDGGARVHVNGWGRKQNTYNSSAAQIDGFVRSHPGFLPVFGAGNSGPQVGSLTAEANSKNALVVGASVNPRPAFENNIGQSTDTAVFSSRGPAGDGRIKPDLVAPGKNIISAASSLAGEHLPGREDYALKEGTSMASAVAGGAAALLRQYLREEEGIAEPRAALLKSLLVNGARRAGTPSGATGFGILDPGSTVLALENDLFQLEGSREGLSTGDSITYTREVDAGGSPFKATLAWTDPAAAPGAAGALVNNLDLEVVTPGGETYYGNDFNRKGVRDGRNNVEQVYIKDPAPGTYKIIVRGTSVREGVTLNGDRVQDFALVYGQPPAREIAASADGSRITTAEGGQLTLPEDTRIAVNDKLQSRESGVPPGTSLYLAGGKGPGVYAAARSFHAGGIKTLQAGDLTVFARINRDYREGGYAADPGAGNVLTINGHPAGGESALPPGAEVTGYVNPFRQTLWQVSAAGEEIEGVLTGIDRQERTVQLLDRDRIFSLSPEASISFSDITADAGPTDLPFGAATAAGLEKLLPGMPVTVILGEDGRVYHLAVRRHVALGRVESVTPGDRSLTLSTGGKYRVLEGARVTRDLEPAAVKDIEAGDLAVLNLAPGSDQVLGVSLYSQVHYGKVIFSGDGTLYLGENRGGFGSFTYGSRTRVFRWGMPAGESIVSSGQWVRVAEDPATGELLRVDIAEDAGRVTGTVESRNPARDTIKIAGDEQYRLGRFTRVLKNGLPVRLRDIKPGEKVTLSALYTPGGKNVAASLEAQPPEGVEAPALQVKSTVPFKKFSMVTGTTSATRLYAHYPGGELEKVELTGEGQFYHPVPAGETGLQLVAVDGETGGVGEVSLEFPRREGDFTDIDGHWAETDITRLAERGMLKGYPDGTFRPDRYVTRVEFTIFLTRLMGKDGTPAELPYRDREEIPGWAREGVALAYSRGLAAGYDDNTFRPHAYISREEAAALLVRACDILQGEMVFTATRADSFTDMDTVSDWARPAVRKARARGLFGGREDNRFEPRANITRAETAAVMNRLLDILAEDKK